MRVSNPGRYLAPVALIATIAATFLVIQDGLNTNRRPTVHTLVAQHRPHFKRSSTYYVVERGNTLSQISLSTGTSVTALERLNPSLDPNALQVGKRLRLRR